MVKDIKLSIITITRNNARGLRKTMESVFAQTYDNFEYILIDGASTDDSVDVIKEYQDLYISNGRSQVSFSWISEKDDGIYDAMNKGIEIALGRRIVNSLNRSELVADKNKGIEIALGRRIVNTLNCSELVKDMDKGVLKSTGEYLLFMNAGDVFASDTVLAEWMQYDIYADVVACNAIFEGSRFLKKQYILSPPTIKSQDLILYFLPHQATFIRKKLFSDIHLYDTSYYMISDWLFFIEAILVHNATYQHINMFVARCETEGITNQPQSGEIIDAEFERGLKQVLPLYYEVFIKLKEIKREKILPYQQFVAELSHSRIMHAVWGLRNWLVKCGYFRCKAWIKQKIYYSRLKREDALMKRKLAKEIEELPLNMLSPTNTPADVILSLTSFGHRVADTVPYTLLSLFRQSRLPNRIVLWLDNEHWNDENLPPLLKHLRKSGLEIYYCEDIKSYKKLIPALRMFPHNPIIVVDDDMYYPKDLVKWLVEAYEQSDKRTIFTTHGNIPEKRCGQYAPYSEWKDAQYGDAYSEVALIGCGGGIYPPDIFDEEIFKQDIYMSLAPNADDLWFWVQEKRLGIPVKLTSEHGYELARPVDRIEDLDVNNADNLTRVNVIQGKNNEQLEKLLEYYNL